MGSRLAHLAASLLAGAGALLFAPALTRLLAFLYPANSIGLLLTVAVGGTCVGALVTHRLGWLPRRGEVLAASTAWAAGAAMAMTVVALTAGSFLGWTLLNVSLAFASFAAIGATISAALLLAPSLAAVTVAAQAAGAGSAASVSPALLDRFGPVPLALGAGAILGLAGGLHWLASLVTHWRTRRMKNADDDVEGEETPWQSLVLRVAATTAGVGALLAVAAVPFQLVTGGLSPNAGTVAGDKSLFTSIRDANLREQVVVTEWDAYSRADVTEPAASSDLKWLYLDGAVAGIIHRGIATAVPNMVRADIGNLPFTLPGAHQKVLVIGAGGGEEVALALASGAQEVVATEVSLGLIKASRRLAQFSGPIFDQTRVRVVNEDGRAYLRGSSEQFDLIYLTLANAGVAQFGGALSGSGLFTVDAFGDYLDHLRQDGRLVIKLRDEEEFTRAFNSAFQALTRRGVTPLDAIRRLLAINNQPVAQRQGGGITLPLLLVRKTPYLEDEARATFEALQRTPFPPIFMPHLEQLSPYGGWAAEGLGPAAFEARAPYDIRPATDASPFFFEFGKGPPWVIFLAIAFLAIAFGVVSLPARRPTPDLATNLDPPDETIAFLDDDVPWRFLGFAAIVGAGFAMLATALLYRLPLLVGQPALTPAIVIGGLLLGACGGSLVAARTPMSLLRPAIGWAALASGVLAVALIELLPLASYAFRAQPLAGRVVVAAVIVTPFGLAAGVPFPAAVRLLANAGRGRWAALLWAAAALAGACASLLALALGMMAGFGYPAGLAALCLFAAFLLAGLKLLVAGPELAPTTVAPPEDHSPFQPRAEREAGTPVPDVSAG